MNDYIRKAVELADGFSVKAPFNDSVEYFMSRDGHGTNIGAPDQWFLDALAAQLVRQVDALDSLPWIHVFPRTVRMKIGINRYRVAGPDRTMNTIKAIVDSGVLK